jgi:hypothetical protein
MSCGRAGAFRAELCIRIQPMTVKMYDPNWKWEWGGRPPELLSPGDQSLAQAEPEYQRKYMSPEERRTRALGLWVYRAYMKADKERDAAPLTPTGTKPPFPPHVKELMARIDGRIPYVKRRGPQ